jgi:hypothetical protein
LKLIKFSQSISGYGDPTRSGDKSFAFAPGQEVLIEKEIATAWTESGIAEFISQVVPEPVAPVVIPVAEYAVARRGPGRPPKAIVVEPEIVAVLDEDKREG